MTTVISDVMPKSATVSAPELTVIELGNPKLRWRSHPVCDIGSDRLNQLIDSLIAKVQAADGVGIAAPQVGQSDRLVIVASRPNARYPHAPEMVPTAMINPRIVAHAATTAKGWEGCLSVPGIRGLVPRYTAVTVEYTNREGQPCRQEVTDFIARIVQHELDHLDGIVFLDRVESTFDLMSEREYQAMFQVESVVSAQHPSVCL
jgi:peptide deformylase